MDKTIVKKRINFGKIDVYGIGRKINAVEVDIELRSRGGDETFIMENGEKKYTGNKTPEYTEFTASGSIWNGRKTDIVYGGQCLDIIARYIKSSRFKEIYELWKKYHLNGLHAGTPEQEAALKEWRDAGNKYDYDAACDYLKKIGLYEVNFTGKTVGRMYDNEPYKYGHAWIVNDLPDEVIERIKNV